MFDFGDELIIDSYKIPWLIWIQIFVMFLLTLTILLSYFGLSLLDDESLTSSSSSSNICLEPPLTCSRRTQVAANHEVRQEVPTPRAEINIARDGSSVKSLTLPQTSELLFHPCRYFEAFLKCFGLGSTSKKSPTRDKEHED